MDKESSPESSFLKVTGLADTTPLEEISPETRVKLDDLKQLTRLKRIYGFGLLGLMAVQLLVVNAVFAIYAGEGFDWHPPDGVVQVWLSATFVQIVSVVYVITRSLFPPEKGPV